MSSIEARLDVLQTQINELRQKEAEARRGLEELKELSGTLEERKKETVEARERARSKMLQAKQRMEELTKTISETRRKREEVIEAQKQITAKKRRARRRIEKPGIPGPAMGPAPMSIGEQVTEKVGSKLTEVHRTLITTPQPPGPALGPRPGSIGAKTQRALEKGFIAQEKAMTQFRSKIEFTIGKLRSRAAEETFFSRAYMTTALGLKFGKGFVESFTYPFRPLKIRESLHGLTTLATSEQIKTEAMQLAFMRFKGDPLGSIAETAGMLAGPYVLEKGISLGFKKIREYQTTKFLETYPVEDFLPGEMEIHAQYPTPYEARAFVLTREKVELGAGFLEAHRWIKGSGGLPALITKQQRYLQRIYSYPVTEYLPGLRTGFPSITQPIGKVSLFPFAWVGIGTALSEIPSVDKPLSEQATKTVQKPKLLQRAKEKPVKILRPKVEPGYVPFPVIVPKPKEETWITPGYKPLSITIQKPITVFPPKPILVLKQPPIQVVPFPPPPMPSPLKAIKTRRPKETYRPKKKKRRKPKKEKGIGILEVRVDPLKTKGIKKRKNSLKEVLKV